MTTLVAGNNPLRQRKTPAVGATLVAAGTRGLCSEQDVGEGLGSRKDLWRSSSSGLRTGGCRGLKTTAATGGLWGWQGPQL